MASGRLGAVKPAAATYKTVYKPSGVVAVVSVSLCNQTIADTNFRMAVTQNATIDQTPSTSDFVAYGSLIKASGDSGFADRAMFGPYELNSANGDQLVVYSTSGDVSFVVTGDEGAV